MSLGDFLTDETLGSWADEMEDMPLASGDSRTGYGERRTYNTGGGFASGGLNDRGYSVREELPMPTRPPYTAHIGNLSFDVTDGEVSDYFHDCSVTNVRIVEDKLERKPKGFGYVEFASVEGLKKALELNGAQFSGRNIRISVAEPPKDRPEAREITDWSRKGPLPDLPSNQRRAPERGFGGGGFGGGRNFDNASDAGSDRGERRRQPYGEGDGKVRDFGNWERRGPLSPAAPTGPPSREGGRLGAGEGPRERRQSPAWGEGRSQDGGSRPPRREFQERPAVDRAPTAADTDSQWRTKMRPDPPSKSPTPSREASTPSSPAAPPAPAMRPKLNLQKRTVSEAGDGASPASAVSTDAKSSPFGGARPIDTFAKEKEIEEKRQLALRQKKEHDDKVREEKRLAKEAAKAEKANASPRPGSKDTDTGADAPPTGKTFEILRKGANGAGDVAAGEAGDSTVEAEGQNGSVVEDKAVKPKEIVRDISNPDQDAAAAQANKTVGAEVPGEASADTLEEDGWSTVSKAKGNRRGNGQPAARAIAS
ncbi:MAG: hypothetical protein M1817_005604 [Caeruleum heppii]|nr:MAG: hypothetical protein M1817_005604 [Caeruleum heppii]